MLRGLWRPSYPEVVAGANVALADGRHYEAGRRYWFAAYLAPTDAEESTMLRLSWIASERAQGRVSELEPL